MRKLFHVVLICFAFIPNLIFGQRLKQRSNSVDFQAIIENFSEPGRDYGTAPLWVWHTKVNKEIIDSMLFEFKNNNFGGVFIHPRSGLITEYLSPEWIGLFKYAVKKGRSLDLNVWIYDENSYPSGYAGGIVPDEMPESYDEGEMLSMKKAEEGYKPSEQPFIVLNRSGDKYLDITSDYNIDDERGNDLIFFEKEHYQKGAGIVGPSEFPYVDLMRKGVTEKFIDATLNRYKKSFGDEFGNYVPGVFSDEPNIMTQGLNNVRWTPDLFDQFQKDWGYDLRINLPSLFEEIGDWKKIRHNYWETLLHLYIDGWAKPYYQYTEDNNLLWTGHYWEHEWPRPYLGPDNMAMYSWHQQPGIDMLFNQFDESDTHAQFGNIRSVKELSSVVNQLGKIRSFSETYGGGGWDLTFKDMKRLGDWEYVLGVNFLNQHLSMMTLTGSRKYDYPQSFSYHSPWWTYYKTLNQYFRRISYVLSQGNQLNKILIIEPTTSAWMYSGATSHTKNDKSEDLGNRFQNFITGLEKKQVEYDLGSEYIIKDFGNVENGKFKIGNRIYDKVILPPGLENLNSYTFALIKEYIRQKGELFVFDSLSRIDGKRTAEFFDLDEDHYQDRIDSFFVRNILLSEDLRFKNIKGGDLYHQRRSLKDGQILFLVNSNMRENTKGGIGLKGGQKVYQLDPSTGEILSYTFKGEKDGIFFNFKLPPAGSLLFFISNEAGQNWDTDNKKSITNSNFQIVKADTKVKRPLENVLKIDFCDIKYLDNDEVLKDINVADASNVVFDHEGFERDPWMIPNVQFKDNIISRNTFSLGSGYMVSYKFRIRKGVDCNNFNGVIEQGNLWSKIMINGHEIKPTPGEWWLDRSFGVLSIGPYLKDGEENTLSLEINPMSIFAEVGPVYIRGDFNLASLDKGWEIIPSSNKELKIGSWKDQGLPFYSFDVDYTKEFTLKELERKGNTLVHLNDWEGTVANVFVNGKDAGIIFSEPFELDISSFTKEGQNEVTVKVIGSLKNLLGPNHKGPVRGIASPGMWLNINKYPAGNDYITLDYGLMEDFDIFKN